MRRPSALPAWSWRSGGGTDDEARFEETLVRKLFALHRREEDAYDGACQLRPGSGHGGQWRMQEFAEVGIVEANDGKIFRNRILWQPVDL